MLREIRIGTLSYFKAFKNKYALFCPEVSGNSLGTEIHSHQNSTFIQGKLFHFIPTQAAAVQKF